MDQQEQEMLTKSIRSRNADEKAWALLDKVVSESMNEQKKARQWKVFFRVLMFAYLALLLWLFVQNSKKHIDGDLMGGGESHVASVLVQGMIADEGEADAERIIKGLKKAFKNPDSKAVMLKINSPGGSPVQSGYVYDEIKRLRGEYPDKQLVAVIEDLGASGAYYIAAAADKIYADKASLVGSIGVISGGFGFVDAMKKVGVERRIYHAGNDKAFLDPFSPQVAQQKEFWQKVLTVTHKQFIDQVKKGRGDRLKGGDEVFSGLIWSGEQALELGLIDGLGSPEQVAFAEAQTRKIVDYSVTEDPWQKFAQQLGASFGTSVAKFISTQAETPNIHLR